MLNNKVCLIVGASGAIGRAIARRFCEESARLALTYHTTSHERISDELRSGTYEPKSYSVDVTNCRQVAEIIGRVERDFSTIDVLVNCSGIVGPIGRLEENDPDEWNQTLQINLSGAFNLARAVVPVFRRRGCGKIIFFSGGGAAYGRPFFTAYSSSKAALVRFTESLAQEVEGDGIQVNAIAPGPVESRMWEQMRAAGAAGGPKLMAEIEDMDKTGGASAERAAALAVFLASHRSDRVTGRLISALWDDWEHIEPNAARLVGSEAWTLRRTPLQ